MPPRGQRVSSSPCLLPCRVNVGCGPAEERVLLTGLHAVADIYCENCKTTLGWKYVSNHLVLLRECRLTVISKTVTNGNKICKGVRPPPGSVILLVKEYLLKQFILSRLKMYGHIFICRAGVTATLVGGKRPHPTDPVLSEDLMEQGGEAVPPSGGHSLAGQSPG